MQSTPSAAGPGGARHGVALLASFLLLSLILLGVVYNDLRPAPLYPSQASHARAPTLFVTARLPLVLRFVPPRSPSRLLIPVWTDPARRPLRIALLEPASRRVLAKTLVTGSGLASLPVPPEAGRQPALIVHFSSDSESRETSPRLLWAEGAPRYGARVWYAGSPLEAVDVLPATGPLVLIEYPWPSRALLVAWLLPLAAGALAWRDPRRAGWLLLSLALCAALTSALLWQRDYTRREAHLDADRYAESATQIGRYLREPEARDAVRGWLRDYPHASTSLVPALLALPVALGAPVALAYLELSALAGLASLLLFLALLERELRLPRPTALLATTLFACHLLTLRSFARPISDAVGLLLVIATLWLLLRRIRGVTQREEVMLALVVLCHPLARPQGFGYWPFVALALLAIDCWREGRRPAVASLVIAQLRVFSPPLLVLAGLYLQFGWLHNVELMLEKAVRFRIGSTGPVFVASLVGVVQALPLLWLPLARRLHEPRVVLLLAWLVWGVSLLVLVRAPFWMRHFLPVLPVMVAMAAAGLAQLDGVRRRAATAIVVALCGLNVAVTIQQIFTPGPLPETIADFISTP